MNFEIIASAWWSSLSEQIGAVLIKTLKGYKAYLGTKGKGLTKSVDEQLITKWGAKVTYDQAKGIFKEEFKKHKITKKTFIT